MKIIFAGTPDFSAEILSVLVNENKYSIPLVLSQPDKPKGRGKKLLPTPVKIIAENNNIEVFQPNKLRNNIEATEKIKSLNPDLIIVVAYGMIIPQDILDIPKFGCINIHTSLLPKWRGAAPIQRAIEAGDKNTGVTIMQMDAGLDTGNILLKEECEITSQDNAQTLTQKLLEISSKLIIKTIHNIDLLINDSIDQKSIKDIIPCYAEKISKEEAHINWNQPAEVISQKIRAFYPFPGAYGFINNNIENIRIKFINVEILNNTDINNSSSVEPGTIIESNKKNILIKTQDENIFIKLIEAQLPGTKSLKSSDILNSKYKDIFVYNNKFI